MASAIEIANMALGYIDEETITAFGEENKRARFCSLYFAASRRRALRLGAWNCCAKRASLGKDGTAPIWGYDNRYLLPGGYIRLIAVKDVDDDFRFSIEDGYILCDLDAPLLIKYVFDDEDVSHFDPLLTTVHAYALAIDLVTPLAHSTTKKKELKDDLDRWLIKAGSIDGAERPPQKYKETTWVRARARSG